MLWVRSLVQEVMFTRSRDDSMSDSEEKLAISLDLLEQGSLNLLVHGKNLGKRVTWLQVNEKSLRTPVYSLFLKCSVLQKFGNPLGKVGF